jgi:hypothetical protein
MTFTRAVAPVGLGRERSYFVCYRCGRVETREQDNSHPE